MSWLCRAANRLWRATALPDNRRFRAALSNPAVEQQKILRRYIDQNQATVFGRDHRISAINSIEEFRRQIPLATWDDYSPYIDRIMASETSVLTRDPVTRLVPSSGSTRAAKLIPYTSALRREFNAAISPWIADLYRGNPDLMNGPAYWSISPAIHDDVGRKSAVPIGFGEDSEYLSPLLKPLVDSTLAVPASVRHIEDINDFRIQTCLHLLVARDLRLISIWHPSFLLLLLDVMEANWQELLDKLRGQHRTRVDELSKLDPRDYSKIWPHMGLISAWGDAHAALHLETLRQRWPRVVIQTKGLLATEAFITIPYADHHPLAVRSHFFEFIDEQNNRLFLAHELQTDATYRVVITTAGGLYRYQLHDRVEMTGRLGATPSLRFLGKADHFSDRFGEKLSEGFVADTISALLKQFNVPAQFAMLAPQRHNSETHYTLILQTSAPLPANLPAALDDALSQNPHYAYCRRLAQLFPATVAIVKGDAYQDYVARHVAAGQRLGNIKPMALSSLDGWENIFKVSEQLRPQRVQIQSN